MKKKITYFEAVPISSANFSVADKGAVSKNALILVEGTHRDNKKRVHTFTLDRLEQIAENTNADLRRGVRIPILEDHNRSQEKTIGDLESEVFLREITEEDPLAQKNKGLIGKMGLFASEVAIKAKRAIQQLEEDLLKTISPGVDILTNKIVEISATPKAAIEGMMFFSDSALTFDDYEESSENEKLQELFEETDYLYQAFMKIVENIYTVDKTETDEFNQKKLVKRAINDFASRLKVIYQTEERTKTTEQKLWEKGVISNVYDDYLDYSFGGLVNLFQLAEDEDEVVNFINSFDN